MRIWLAATLFAATGAVLATTGPAAAHHGDTGVYDRSRPTYFAGEVVTTEYEFPHAEISVAVPDAVAVPADRDRFAELDVLDGRPTTSRLVPAAAGQYVILFPPELSGDVAGLPQTGQQAVAVAYPRCPQGNEYDGEYRVQALVTTDGQVRFRRAGSPTGYGDGCPAVAADRWSTAAIGATALGAAVVLAAGVLVVVRVRRARRS